MTARRWLDGRYRLIELLGEGGMSVVWRGHDRALDRPVAIKLLTARYAARPGGWDRIRAEAQAAAKLSHPHVTSVYDYGEAPVGDGGPVPYVVMELLSGSTLAERLRTGGPLPARTALQVCAQVAGALAAAHGIGLVHRDVKPANVMLTPGGVKVLDFGIAAAAGTPDESILDGEVWGTPGYLAPERLAAGEVMPASDVYALGLLLYVAVTGRRPWPARTVDQVLAAHRFATPAPLPPVDGLPPEAVAVCHQCLAKDFRERPAAHEVARVLAEAVGWRVTAALAPWSGTVPDQLSAAYTRRVARMAGVPRVRPPVPAGIRLDLDRLPPDRELEPGRRREPGRKLALDRRREPTGPTVALTGPAWRGGDRWRVVALAGSTLAVIAASSAGIWAVEPDLGLYSNLGPGAAGLGTAIASAAPELDRTGAGRPAPGSPAGPIAPPGQVPTTGGTGSGSGGEMPAGAPDRPAPDPASPAAGAGPTRPAPTSPAPAATTPASPSPSPPDSGPGTDPPADPTPTPSPTPTGPPPVSPTPTGMEESFGTAAGTVVARCDGSTVTLMSWSPAAGYSVTAVEPGPGPQAQVQLAGPDGTVTVVVGCESGGPVAAVSTV